MPDFDAIAARAGYPSAEAYEDSLRAGEDRYFDEYRKAFTASSVEEEYLGYSMGKHLGGAEVGVLADHVERLSREGYTESYIRGFESGFGEVRD